jgi:hypothetical protein
MNNKRTGSIEYIPILPNEMMSIDYHEYMQGARRDRTTTNIIPVTLGISR